MTSQASSEVSGDRLAPEDYPGIFCDLAPALDPKRARIEASRCYYCYDAPCIQACPTQIDIPSFIRKVGNGNVRGAALDILGANILGGTCARACPVETLCQEACVREKAEAKPVQIGQLQRYATDEFFKSGEQPFKREKPTGKKVAVVGAGPAGLSCAHRLARFGHDVVIFEAREKSGGLNEYGLAPYKMAGDFAQREVEFVLGVGGIEIRHGQKLGRDLSLEELQEKYDAVFLGIGLGDTNRLGIPGEDLPGVIDAVKQIAEIRQARDLSKVPVGRHVVVIGGGNTAVDISIQSKRLGAEFVTLVYRRGAEHMGATHHEQELAQKSGVLIKTWAMPVRVIGPEGGPESGTAGGVREVEFEYTRLGSSGKLEGTGKTFTLRADQVFKAIGQKLDLGPAKAPQDEGGKIQVADRAQAQGIDGSAAGAPASASFETSIPGVYAGGDCVGPGEDLTVTAVEQGKRAAITIHARLSTQEGAHG